MSNQRTLDPEIAKDEAIIEKMFSFKKTWNSFSQETRNFIMESMNCLVKICTKYIEFL